MSFRLFLSMVLAGVVTAALAETRPTAEGSDTERLERAIARATADGGDRHVVVPAKPDGSPWCLVRSLNLTSDFVLTLDGAHLVLATNAFCNLFRSSGTTNVTVVGRNGATADGGDYNGLSERNAGREGRPPIWVNNILLFTNVRGFRVEGVRFVRQNWWALNFIGCSEGVIRRIDFLSHHITVRKDGTRLETVGSDYEGILAKNSDGIDLRAGCHDIVIEDITGFCEDDIVALTCLPSRMEKTFLTKDAEFAIRRVKIRRVHAASLCSIVRLLAQGGGRLSDVEVDDVVDTSDGKTYMTGHGRYGVRLGDTHLWGGQRQSLTGEVRGVSIRNVQAAAWEAAVCLAGVSEDVTVENVKTRDGCPKAIVDLRANRGMRK